MKVNSPIAVSALNIVSKPFKMLSNAKWMTKICDKFEMSPQKAADIAAITSIVAKDGISCFMYVYQSLHNEKIPEEKRGFVAALDLTNGGLMILSQLLMYFTFNHPKFQAKLFGKLFNKTFSDKAKKNFAAYIRNNPEYAKMSKEEIFKSFDKIKDTTRDTFGSLTSLVAATIIAKRIIVPFIATPLAGWAQKNILNKYTKKPQDKDSDIENNGNKAENSENKIETSQKPQNTNLLEAYTKK